MKYTHMMQTLQYICGRCIRNELVAERMHLCYVPASILRYIQTLNPYLYNGNIIKSRTDTLNELALYEHTSNDFISRIKRYWTSEPSTIYGDKYEYTIILVNAILNNNMAIVKFILIDGHNEITAENILDAVRILKRFQVYNSMEYICDIYINAIQENSNAILYVPYKLRSRKICSLVDCMYLNEVPKKLRTKTMCYNAVCKQDSMLQYVPHKFKDFCKFNATHLYLFKFLPNKYKTPKLCKLAVIYDIKNITHVPHCSLELCYLAVYRNPQAFAYIPRRFKTPSMCELAVSGNASLLKYVPAKLRTLQLCTLAVTAKYNTLQYVPNNIKTVALCKLAVAHNPFMLQHVPNYLTTHELCCMACHEHNDTFQYVPLCMRTLKLCKKLIMTNVHMMQYVPYRMLTPQICWLAVRKSVFAIKYVPRRFRTLEMCKFVVNVHGDTLKYVPLRTPEICYIAMLNNRSAIEYIPPHMRTFQICEMAMCGSSYKSVQYFQFIPHKYKTATVCRQIISRSGCSIRYVLNKTPALCELAMAMNSTAFMYIDKSMMTFNLCKRMVARDPRLYKYIPDCFKSNTTHTI